MAASIAEEDGAAGTVADFEDKLQLHGMRCHVCPERLAIWRDKKTGAHLSGFAAKVLGQEQLIQTKNLRLLHHRQWCKFLTQSQPSTQRFQTAC
jgi:sterol 3beta-glucosyltransferase